MHQIELFNDIPSSQPKDKVVNVASVKQLSVFRYPGGKTWLIPTISKWLNALDNKLELFIEPFLGGGIVSLSVAYEDLASTIIMNELDDQIAAVWHTLVYGDIEWLQKRIISFNLNIENIKRVISAEPTTIEEKAFITILKNRTYHGGIIAPGAGFLKNGESGKGIRSRWYPSTLVKRIEIIKYLRPKLEYYDLDAFVIIAKYLECKNTAFFIDPPYTASRKKAGKRLYRYHNINHEKLFEIFSFFKGPFLITYDNDDDIIKLCKKYSMKYKLVPMKNTHHNEIYELIISNNLDWY